jgi:hypothetical protein
MDLSFKYPGLGNLPLQRMELYTSQIRAVCHIGVPFTEVTARVSHCSLDTGFLIWPTRITAKFTISTVSGSERPLAVRLRVYFQAGKNFCVRHAVQPYGGNQAAFYAKNTGLETD